MVKDNIFFFFMCPSDWNMSIHHIKEVDGLLSVVPLWEDSPFITRERKESYRRGNWRIYIYIWPRNVYISSSEIERGKQTHTQKKYIRELIN